MGRSGPGDLSPPATMIEPVSPAARRARMVDLDLRRRGIQNEEVLAAMAEVPREHFVPPDLVPYAYEDGPLPIGEGQTISQPFVVALMIEALEPHPHHLALDVGTGSGYAAAVLSRVVARVHSVERHPRLAEAARGRLAELGYDNVEVHVGDGSLGWEQGAPYDGIMVAAGAPRVPPSLRDQLALGGRLVIPVGPWPWSQTLIVEHRIPDGWETTDLGPVRFVPLVGNGAWSEDSEAGSTPLPPAF